MSTFVSSATQLAYVMRTASSSWDFSGAVQGVYGGGYPRVGAMLFPTIGNVDWSRQIINSIQLRLTFMSAGSNTGKTIGLYRGTKNSISGTGQSMIGSEIGSFSSNGNAYNATRTIVFSNSSNATVFTNLVSWLTSSPISTLVIYRDEPDGGDWSANYLKISSASITVDYDPAGSTGTLSASTVEAGESISLDITPPDGVDVSDLSHTITWACGEASATHTVTGANLSDTILIPISWASQFPNAMSARATCELATFVNNVYRASTTLAFTIVAPQSLAPSIQASATVLDTTGGAYQYLSRILLQITDASAQNGATIVSYKISGTEGVSSNDSSYTTPKVQQSGEHTYTFTVKDSRGLTATATQTVNVIAVHKPVITSFSVERYAEVVGDTVTYVSALYGDKVWVNAQVAFDDAGGNNTGEAWIRYNEVGVGSQSQVSVPVTNNTVNVSNDRSILTNTISAQFAFEFELYVEDDTGSSGAFARVTKGFCPLYIDRTGYGVGVGAIVDNVSEANSLFRCGFPAEFNEQVVIDGTLNTKGEVTASGGIRGVTNYSPQEIDTGGSWIDGRPIYRCTFNTTFTESNTFVTLGSMPDDFGQVVRMYGVLYVRGQTMLIPNAFYNSLDHMATPLIDGQNVILALGAGFGSNEKQCVLTIEYTKSTDYDADGFVTMPPKAMTANSQYGCTITASGTYTSNESYQARNAFDRDRTTIWASNASGEKWIQLKMPYALTEISVEIYEYDNVSLYPVSGNVQGSNSGTNWVTIGTFGGWSNSAMSSNGLLGRIICDNTVGYSYVRFNVTECVNNQQFDLAEMRIKGKIPSNVAMSDLY